MRKKGLTRVPGGRDEVVYRALVDIVLEMVVVIAVGVASLLGCCMDCCWFVVVTL